MQNLKKVILHFADLPVFLHSWEKRSRNKTSFKIENLMCFFQGLFAPLSCGNCLFDIWLRAKGLWWMTSMVCSCLMPDGFFWSLSYILWYFCVLNVFHLQGRRNCKCEVINKTDYSNKNVSYKDIHNRINTLFKFLS